MKLGLDLLISAQVEDFTQGELKIMNTVFIYRTFVMHSFSS